MSKIPTIPKAFTDTLGRYVYMYKQDGQVVYVGKGVNGRCLDHITTKGFSYDDLYIVARNLEDFDAKEEDSSSFAIESLLIHMYNPSHNSVSGHYKENMVMVKFSELFNDYVDGQFDAFAELPNWYIDNYDSFKGKVSEVKIINNRYQITSSAKSAIWFKLFQTGNNEDTLDVLFESSTGNKDTQAANTAKICQFLDANNITYECDTESSKKDMITVDQMPTDQAIELWNNFLS